MALDQPSNVETDAFGNFNARRKASYSQNNDSVSVKTGAGLLKGIFVSTVSGTPTLKIWDETGAGTNELVETFTPVAATMYDFGSDVIFNTGLYVQSAAGGSVEFTVLYQ